MPVVRPLARRVRRHDHAFADRDEVLRFECHPVHHLVEGLEVAPDPLVAPIGVRLGRQRGRRRRLELRVDQRYQRLHISLAQRLEALANQLHVPRGHPLQYHPPGPLLSSAAMPEPPDDFQTAPLGGGRSRHRRGAAARAPSPAEHAGDDRVGELRPAGGARGGRVGADQQVRRGLSRAAATTAAARRSTSPSSSRSTARRSCSAPSTRTSSPTPARRPTTPPTWRCSTRATRSWGWRSTTAGT